MAMKIVSHGLDSIELSDKTFYKFSKLIYAQAGIVLGDAKKQLVKSRLIKRIRTLGLESFDEYFKYIEKSNFSGEEMILMLDAISTNKTHFFREESHFNFLTSNVLPDIVAKHPTKYAIKVWSAACSTGEEVYTLGIVLSEFLKNNSNYTFNFLATDISTKVLQKAELGVYPSENVVGISKNLLRTYFQKGQNNFADKFRVKESLRKITTFKRLNFMDADWGIRDSFDIIFCRNAMIYFDKPTQKTLVGRFHQYLKPGGYLFIGHSESLLDSRHLFKYIQPTVYQK
ncbi:MAG: protein-glutamate O-methyltransferase CheR [Nitrospinae bacterium]|nr:protein-glutamate O-methyltransferase CheR [Nitrospinota bacterium]